MEAMEVVAAEFFLDLFSSDDERDEEIVFVMLELVLTLCRQERNRARLYVEFLVPRYVDLEFRRMFHRSREAASQLADCFESSCFYPNAVHGRQIMSAEKRCLVALTCLSTQVSMAQTADKFDVAESSVQNGLNRLLDFLLSISEEAIKWSTY
ncbi:hypothetical protein HPB49_010564 [Dermacentor silvarum]|uniref:Uncharacterized protein n=1 Tax=Dermacentor silvarum TaxID=543639 RepID=A0ACB8DZ14_DERSI|nr:hypothetical protein HPB49_010564 [Dermacentor silvarum]